MAQPAMEKPPHPTDRPQPETTSLEGYLEYAQPISPDPSRASTGPPVSHGDETRIPAADDPAQPTTDVTDQTDREREVLLNLPIWKKRTLFCCSCALQFLLQFDMAAVAAALHDIAVDRKAPQVKVFAVGTVYLLAQTVFQLVFSHVSHAAGSKAMYITGIVLFLIGAVLSAASSSIDVMIGARVVQGIGAAGMSTMSAIVIVEMTQPRQRAGWTSISQAFGALGNICGPLLVGLFKGTKVAWRGIFGFEAIITAVLFVSLTILLPGEPRSRRDRLRELTGCDWVGMLAFFASSVGILVPINIGGTNEALSWASAPVLTCFAFGFISLVFLIYYERHMAKRPAFPREVFARLATRVAFFGNATCGVLISMVFYHLVLFWEGVRQKSAMGLGKMLLAVTLTYPVAFAITGLAIRRWGRIKYATAAGAVLATTGLGLMQLMTQHHPQAALLVISSVAAAGCGIFAPSMVNAVLATTDSRWHPHAIATRTLLYTAGNCVGVSLGLAIFSNTFRGRFTAHDGDAALRAKVAQAALSGPQELIGKITELNLLSPRGELTRMVVGALRAVWAFACVLAGVTGAAAILMRFPDLAADRTTGSGVPDEERQENSHEMASRP